jgi:hypothetical protein
MEPVIEVAGGLSKYLGDLSANSGRNALARDPEFAAVGQHKMGLVARKRRADNHRV